MLLDMAKVVCLQAPVMEILIYIYIYIVRGLAAAVSIETVQQHKVQANVNQGRGGLYGGSGLQGALALAWVNAY